MDFKSLKKCIDGANNNNCGIFLSKSRRNLISLKIKLNYQHIKTFFASIQKTFSFRHLVMDFMQITCPALQHLYSGAKSVSGPLHYVSSWRAYLCLDGGDQHSISGLGAWVFPRVQTSENEIAISVQSLQSKKTRLLADQS